MNSRRTILASIFALAASLTAVGLSVWLYTQNRTSTDEEPATPSSVSAAAGEMPAALQNSSGGVATQQKPPQSTSRTESQTSGGDERNADPRATRTQSAIRLPTRELAIELDALEAEINFVCQQLLTSLPNNAVGMHINAMFHAQLHRTDEAAKWWRRCIEVAPSTEQYYVNLATLDLDRGKSQSALETLKAALAQGLNTEDVTHHLGLAQFNLGMLEEAEATASGTLKDLPDSVPHWITLGQAQLGQGNAAEAEKSFRRAIELGANNATVYYGMFNACLRNGNREEALRYRELVEEINPDKGARSAPDGRQETMSQTQARQLAKYIFSEAALLYEENGRQQDAEHLLLRTLALAPDDRNAVEQLADFMQRRGRLPDQELLRDRLLELPPVSTIDYLKLAKVASLGGNHSKAEAAIKLAIANSPTSVIANAAMAQFLMEQRAPERAEWYVRQAIALEPGPDGFRLLAQTLRAQGKEAEALAAEKEIGQLDANR